jgi:predicted small lipoprotein YifL
MRVIFLLALALSVAALSACGRRGALEAPGSEPPPPLDDSLFMDSASPGAQDPAGTGPAEGVPERPFILDPLI